MIEKTMYSYTSNTEGAYQVYMELYLTEEGQAKIEEIKNNYAILEDEVEEIQAAQNETEDEEENSENTTEIIENKKIAKLTIAESEYDVTQINDEKIKIKIGSATTNSTSINNNLAIAAELALLINSGKYPLEYEIKNNRFEYTDITITYTQILYLAIIIAIILFVVFIIKYRTKGLLLSISLIGFVAILTLILRYTNVSLSIEGIGAIILVIIINIITNKLILNNLNSESNLEETVIKAFKEIYLKMIPVMIISLVFCFARVSNLNSFGMVMFWGLVLIAIYNVAVTKTLLKLKENK